MATTTGGCLCGAARYRLAEPPRSYGACHCGMCRRWTGGVQLAVMVPAGGLAWEAEDTVRVYPSSDWADRGFCGTCGGALFWRFTAPGPMQGLMGLCAGTLDDMDGLAFDEEVYVDAKPASYAFAGARKRMTEAEVLAMVGAPPTEGGA